MPSLLKPLGLLFWSKFNFNSMSCKFAYSAGQSLLCVALLLQIRLIIQYGLTVVKWEGENFSCRWELLVYYQNIFYVYDNLGHICEWRKEKDSKAMYHLKIGSTLSVLKELSCKKMKNYASSWIDPSSLVGGSFFRTIIFRRFWLYSIDGVNNMWTVVAMCTLVR